MTIPGNEADVVSKAQQFIPVLHYVENPIELRSKESSTRVLYRYSAGSPALPCEWPDFLVIRPTTLFSRTWD